jgi:hypothetical protein
MSASFASDDAHAAEGLRPVRVPIRKEAVYEEGLDRAGQHKRWTVVRSDERELCIVCERAGGLLRAPSTVTIRVEGPDGLPSAVVTCSSESRGGPFARDRANVLEFMVPFRRRVC